MNHFYNLGWFALACCFYFNISFIAVGCYDLCVGVTVSNREKMDNARKKYYYNKIQAYEKDN